ncbi:MAG: hypothetical protein QOH58_1766 [Thermoleophilaceae bacterium]|jgi:hypothetical protein|nr:hypothetical protein [Thermoleophilaceae bacterium]
MALAGAVALASGAYGLGSQAGDGSAVAEAGAEHNGKADWQRGPNGAFGGLADALGTDNASLQKALRAFHETNGTDRRDEFASALAKALDKSPADVQAAFDALAEKREGRFAARLADQLGLDAADVRAALDGLRDERPPGGPHDAGPRGFAAVLAHQLGVDADDVESALEAVRPRGPGRGHRHGAQPLRQLAAELDVTRPELRKALAEVRSEARSGMDDRRAELVAFLADRFGVSKEKVEAALPQFRGPGPRPGPAFAPGVPG